MIDSAHLKNMQHNKRMIFSEFTQKQKDRYIREAKQLCDILSKMGLNPHLGFGSLLGAVRGAGKLIDSDYDIDICYLSKFDNPEDIIIECQELYKELIEKGILIKYWDIEYNPITDVTKEIPKTFGQAHIKIGEFTIDLFTTWLDEKNNYNTCQWGNLGKFTTFELSTIENQSFSIPENYDEILTNLYGNWRVPTKDHPSKYLKRKSYLKIELMTQSAKPKTSKRGRKQKKVEDVKDIEQVNISETTEEVKAEQPTPLVKCLVKSTFVGVTEENKLFKKGEYFFGTLERIKEINQTIIKGKPFNALEIVSKE